MANGPACTGTFSHFSGNFTAVSGNYTNNTGTFAADNDIFAGYSGDFSCVVTYGEYIVTVGTVIARSTTEILDGDVIVLMPDYTVQAVAGSTEVLTFTESIPAGVNYVYGLNAAFSPVVEFDPNDPNKFIVVYSDLNNNLFGSVIVGTISGNVISYGSIYPFFGTLPLTHISASFDPNTKGQFVVAYGAGSLLGGQLLVGTIFGTAVSFSSPFLFSPNDIYYPEVKFDPATPGKLLVTFWDPSNLSGEGEGAIVVGTKSGSLVSFGSPVSFNSGSLEDMSIAFDYNSPGKFVVCYQDLTSNLRYGTAIAGEISGTSVVLGSKVVFNAASTVEVKVITDPSETGKFVVFYAPGGVGYGTAVVGSITGVEISFGAAQTFNSFYTHSFIAAFNPHNPGNILLGHANAGYESILTTFTMSGDTLVVGSSTNVVEQFTTGTSKGLAFDPNSPGKFVFASDDLAIPFTVVGQMDATQVVLLSSNLTETNFIGIATQYYPAGAITNITTSTGTAINMSGLTQGTTYYVLGDGSISDTPDEFNVEIGVALSSTSLLIT